MDSKNRYILIVIIIIIIIILLCIIVKRKTKDKKNDDEPKVHVLDAIKTVSKTKKKTSSVSKIDESTPQKKTSDEVKPPTNGNVSVDGSSIFAYWPDVEGVDTYTIYYSDKPDFTKDNARIISNIDKGDFVINKVPQGTYYIRISSTKFVKKGTLDPRREEVESEMSDMHTVKVDKCNLPSTPTNVNRELIVSPSNNHQNDDNHFDVFISWDPDTTVDAYLIHLNHTEHPSSNDSDFSVIRVDDVNSTGHELNGLDITKKWYATVSAFIDHCGPSEPSAIINLN